MATDTDDEYDEGYRDGYEDGHEAGYAHWGSPEFEPVAPWSKAFGAGIIAAALISLGYVIGVAQQEPPETIYMGTYEVPAEGSTSVTADFNGWTVMCFSSE